MKSSAVGKSISKVEVLNISSNGIWILVYEKEYFLSYKDFPWFKNGTIADILDVKLLHDYHLYWPKLDVDLVLESLEEPGNYPLVYI